VKWPVHCTLVQGIRGSRLQLPEKDLTGLHGDGQEGVKIKKEHFYKKTVDYKVENILSLVYK
jgi:hypothetical protein